ncbi:DNA-binding transcriptional LysR family regulator [Rhodoferax ferrireducens]|uniref:DNA-binding transcriptional LysR family regulator n=1 Tax=Rhodoferax ferrireducens TaxID=192843 RepID=A0ABU2CC75_9BURK|nr:LysR family transcriptional regulator [Rhodoferax ferrireducens]MDR7378921.1 DNA-binding transcriptional LysR family regulator [Rhodoferax ferrireducens]
MSTIRFLRTFLVVAQEGSYAGAAERVALTQAAVGLQMRALEAELKTGLFERSGRGVLLTVAGRALIAHAEKIIASYDQMREGLEQDGEIAGTVTVGSTVSAMGLLSNTVVAMKPRFPRLNVRLVVQESSGLAQSVIRGALDAAVLIEGTPLERQGLLWTPLYVEPLVLVASALVAKPDSDIKQLLRENPFLRFDRRTPSGIRIEQTLRKLGLMPQDFLELSSVSSIVDLVRQNVGVTVVPHWRNADWVNDPTLQVLPLPGRPATRQVGMLEHGRREHITTQIRLQMLALLARKA